MARAWEDFLEGVELFLPLTSACSPGPPHPVAKLPQGGGGPAGEVGGG